MKKLKPLTTLEYEHNVRLSNFTFHDQGHGVEIKCLMSAGGTFIDYRFATLGSDEDLESLYRSLQYYISKKKKRRKQPKVIHVDFRK